MPVAMSAVEEALNILRESEHSAQQGNTNFGMLALQAAATITSALLALSPFPDVMRMRAAGTTGNKKFAPFFAMALNYTLGFLYGVATNDTVRS